VERLVKGFDAAVMLVEHNPDLRRPGLPFDPAFSIPFESTRFG
jgi:hypothetical protein